MKNYSSAPALVLAASLAACGGWEDTNARDTAPLATTIPLQDIGNSTKTIDMRQKVANATNFALTQAWKDGITCSLWPDGYTITVATNPDVEVSEDTCIVEASNPAWKANATLYASKIDTLKPRFGGVPAWWNRVYPLWATPTTYYTTGSMTLPAAVDANLSIDAFINPDGTSALPPGFAYDPKTNILSWRQVLPGTYSMPRTASDTFNNEESLNVNITVVEAEDNIETITLSVTNITTTGFLAKCNIVDLDGATGTCTVTDDATGNLVDQWSISDTDRLMTNLPSGRSYTVTLDATRGVRGSDNTVVETPINKTLKVTTAVETDKNAPKLAPGSSENLGNVNIGETRLYPLTFDEPINSVSIGTLPLGMSVTATKSWNAITLVVKTTKDFSSFGENTIPLTVSDARWNSGVVAAKTVVNDVAPVAGGAFAALGDMLLVDNWGLAPITPINAGGVVDPLGRAINYSVIGLLPAGLMIDSTTGIISWIHDANWTERYTITIAASNGTSQIQKTFIITFNDIW